MIATALVHTEAAEIEVSVTEPAVLRSAIAIARESAQALFRTVDADDENSEVHAFSVAEGAPVLVSTLLHRVVTEALLAADLTDGAVRAVRPTEQTPRTGRFAWLRRSSVREGLELDDQRSVPSWHRADIGDGIITLEPGYDFILDDVLPAFLADDIARTLTDRLGYGAKVTVRTSTVEVTTAAGTAPSDGWRISGIGNSAAPLTLPCQHALAVRRLDAHSRIAVLADSALLALAGSAVATTHPDSAARWLSSHRMAGCIVDDADRKASTPENMIGAWPELTESQAA
ncbi:hypothetical protein GCM10027169_05750 [Gordonia jinhuaensis]|uniref:FAD:protein FMN transferase n=1 Tax=Gordonia jinhuaensis TaxID=1517702 RepID=A0A916WNT2_9ACTN|nr:hypothetical protein [Gordonia jinhuaensis]GGB20170.1 hypothetical protein GCM10011489_05360 [Gordonia jinhuaensis]